MSGTDSQKIWPNLFPFQRAIMASELSTHTRMVALVLCRHADIAGRVKYLALPTIARETGCSYSAASRAVGALSDAGWAERTDGGTGDKPSAYQLAIPEGAPRSLEEADKKKRDEFQAAVKDFVSARKAEGSRHRSDTGIGTGATPYRHRSDTVWAEERHGVGTQPTSTTSTTTLSTTAFTARARLARCGARSRSSTKTSQENNP